MSLREIVQPNKGDKRHIPRDENGHFTDSQLNVGKSVAAAKRTRTKTVVPKGQVHRCYRTASGSWQRPVGTP
jgi:hypothetical protein